MINYLGPLCSLFIIIPIVSMAYMLERKKPPRNFKKYETLDGLRGIAAISVFLSHCSLFYYFNKNGQWTFPHASFSNSFYNNCGSGAVTIFFIMSSFLFYGKIKEQINFFILFKSRIYRLFPLYFFSSIIGFLILLFFKKNNSISLDSILRTLMFSGVNNIFGLSNVSLMTNGTAWTLPYEWSLYLLLPLGWIMIKKEKHMQDIMISLVSWTIFLLYSSFMNLDYKYLFIFTSGIISYEIIIAINGSKIEKYFRSAYSSILVLVLLIIIIFLSITATGPNSSILYPSSIFIYSLIFLIIASGNTMFGALISSPARKLGDLSYSFYLLQFIFMWIGFEVVFYHYEKTITFLWHFAVSGIIGVILLLFSNVTFQTIEMPFISAAKAKSS